HRPRDVNAGRVGLDDVVPHPHRDLAGAGERDLGGLEGDVVGEHLDLGAGLDGDAVAAVDHDLGAPVLDADPAGGVELDVAAIGLVEGPPLLQGALAVHGQAGVAGDVLGVAAGALGVAAREVVGVRPHHGRDPRSADGVDLDAAHGVGLGAAHRHRARAV